MTRYLSPLACVALVLGVSAAACSGSETGKSMDGGDMYPTASNEPVTSDDDRACTKDDECVVVETKCCDHCNGGRAEAFLKAKADAHKPQGCANTACTEMACGEAVAVCKNGKCDAEVRPLNAPPS